MKTNEQYKPSHSIAILCVGDPKSGKTRLMMSFPVPGIIDADLNLNSAVRIAGEKKFFYSQPSLDDATGKEVPEEDRWLRVVSETKLLLANPEIKTICIDGLTTISPWLLAHAEKQMRLAGINTEKEYMKKYTEYIRIMSAYITMIRSAGKIVFATCHQLMDKEEGTGRVRYALAVPGQLKDRLGGYFTDVWGALASPSGNDCKYEIRTKPTGFHVNLGTSFDLPPGVDVTNKTPDAIWTLLAPKLGLSMTTPASTPTPTTSPTTVTP